MNTLPTKFALLACLPVLSLFASDLDAQWTVRSKTGSHYKSFGNSHLGGSARVYSSFRAMRQGGLRYAHGSASVSGYVKFLGRSSRVAYLSGTVHSDNYSSNRDYARVLGYLGPLRVLNSTRSGARTHTLPSYSRTMNLYPTDPSFTFTIAYVPVTVKGNVGIGVSTSGSARLGFGRALLNHTASGWGYARASARAGIPGFNVGLEATGRVANQKVTTFAQADALYNFTVSGLVVYKIRAISVKLKACITLLWKRCKTLVNWSSAEVRVSNLLNL